MQGDFRMGRWLVCPNLNTVKTNDRVIRLEPKFMQVLAYLADRAGEVVSKEELIRAVWADTFVTDDVLTRAISELRRVFGDDARQPRVVETVAKRGYRIIASVEPVSVNPSPRRAWPRNRIIVLALALLIASTAGFALYRQFSRRRAMVTRVRSIAVLPLENLSHDPDQEYFAEGMTEALIDNLCMIDGNSDANLWARSFDRDLSDVLMLESDVAQAVAGEIRVKLTPADLARIPSAHPVNRKAHDAYLRGRYLWSSRNKRDLEESITFYQQAIEEDSQYALAYAAMADSYIVLEGAGEMSPRKANPQIKAAAFNAVAADPGLAEAHMMLADVKETEWDWAGAEQEYKRAIQLNPGLARAHHWYALLLSALKRHSEAASEIERAVDLEPLRPNLYLVQAGIYSLAGRYDQALETLNTSPMKAGDPNVEFSRGTVYLRKGEYEEAISKIRAGTDSQRGDAMDLALLGYAYALAGKRQEALRTLDELHQRANHEYVDPLCMSTIWMGFRDKKKALSFLDEGYRLHSSLLMGLASDPVFEPLHSDRRFQDLLYRIGLPTN
jgi:DNA-binding winged helix-turn-helix (wHTH) protein/tetratricopeptide (TPR) repeat protein